ncbi:MAG: signal transduction histidine kinase [Glaciecola sp.]|jgi:signal transduction histidine kinase
MRGTGGRGGTLLARLVGAFAVVLVISLAIVAIFETSRNRAALSEQAENILQEDLGILHSAVSSSQANARAALADAPRDPRFRDAVRSRDPVELNRAIERLASLPPFSHVAVLTRGGEIYDGSAGPPPLLSFPQMLRGASGLVLAGTDGRHFLMFTQRVSDDAVLVGGQALDHARAAALRALVAAHVLLVSDGQVVGSTLLDKPRSPPAFGAEGPDGEVATVDLGGTRTLVGYTKIASAQGEVGQDAWIAVTVEDPLARLDGALSRDRALGSLLLAFVGVLLALVMFRLVTRPVGALTAAATRIANGDLDHEFKTAAGSGELGDLALALDRMLQTLQRNTSTIDKQARHLRLATERLVHARDDERQRMAATLHDGFQQRLVVLRMRLRDLEGPVDRLQIDILADDVLGLLGDLRRLSHDLYPSILRDRGLGAAVHSLVSGAPASVAVELEPDPFPRLPLLVESNAYFLIAEGMTNALKHAPGSSVQITARVFAREVEVSVIDDGPGFEIASQPGVGLTGFQDRAAAVGGSCDFASDENGTWIVARLPIPVDPERPFVLRRLMAERCAELRELRDYINAMKARGEPWPPLTAGAPPKSAALQEQQNGGDALVEVLGRGEAKLGEDGVGVLLDGAHRNGQ